MFAGRDEADTLRTIDEHIPRSALADNTGIVITEPGSSVLHMPLMLCTSRYLKDYVESMGFEVIGSAAANPLTTYEVGLPRTVSDTEATANLVDLELILSEQPEMADAGEWVLVAADKVGD